MAGSDPDDVPQPSSVPAWIAAGTLDAELAAVLWLLAEGGVPIVVAAQSKPAGDALAAALVALGRPPSVTNAFPATVAADDLEGVFERLAAAPFRLTPDAIRSVGVVTVLRIVEDDRRRLTSTHYVRPLEQDQHGHIQRRPPALLAAWDPGLDRFDDYAWALATELAGRVGREPAAFEDERRRRAGHLATLAAAGVRSGAEIAAALASYVADRSHHH